MITILANKIGTINSRTSLIAHYTLVYFSAIIKLKNIFFRKYKIYHLWRLITFLFIKLGPKYKKHMKEGKNVYRNEYQYEMIGNVTFLLYHYMVTHCVVYTGEINVKVIAYLHLKSHVRS